jgi:flagellar biogenesis protein FliO
MTPAQAQSMPPRSAASVTRFPELPLRRDAASGTGVAGWLVIVLVLAAAAGLVWKRRFAGPARSTPGIVVAASRPLTTHASLHVVEWEGERLLLACTPGSADVISRRPIGASEKEAAAR